MTATFTYPRETERQMELIAFRHTKFSKFAPAGSDEQDFQELSRWDVERLIKDAFELGKEAR